jgi:hypothetical protein
VAEILGVVNDDAPLNNKVPPIAAEYQSIVDPEGAVAVKVTAPEPQLEKLLSDVGAVGSSLTVTIVAALVEGAQVPPNPSDASVTVTV